MQERANCVCPGCTKKVGMFGAVCSVNEAQEEGHGEKPFFQTVEPLLAAFPGGGLSLGPVCCLSVHSSFPYIRNGGPIKSLYAYKLIWINLLSCSKRGEKISPWLMHHPTETHEPFVSRNFRAASEFMLLISRGETSLMELPSVTTLKGPERSEWDESPQRTSLCGPDIYIEGMRLAQRTETHNLAGGKVPCSAGLAAMPIKRPQLAHRQMQTWRV